MPSTIMASTQKPSRELKNLCRRVDRARRFPDNTCPASRHLHMIAEHLAVGRPYPMLLEEPQLCAESMLSVLEQLFKLRSKHSCPSPPRP